MQLVRSNADLPTARAVDAPIDRKPLVDWLVNETSHQRFVDNLFQ